MNIAQPKEWDWKSKVWLTLPENIQQRRIDLRNNVNHLEESLKVPLAAQAKKNCEQSLWNLNVQISNLDTKYGLNAEAREMVMQRYPKVRAAIKNLPFGV